MHVHCTVHTCRHDSTIHVKLMMSLFLLGSVHAVLSNCYFRRFVFLLKLNSGTSKNNVKILLSA